MRLYVNGVINIWTLVDCLCDLFPGHTMIFNKPLLIVFGGNNGQQACVTATEDVNRFCLNLASRDVEAECDIWILDVERSPFAWQEAMDETMTLLPPATINLS